MKKRLIYIALIISFKATSAQSSITGCYGRQDSQISLKADSTFFFFHAIDLSRGWVKGRWELNGKRIILTPQLIYDTITVVKAGLTADSLILSRDYTSERLTEIDKNRRYIFDYHQNEALCPKILEYEDDLLYVIKKNKRQKKKQGGYFIQPFDPWFTKGKCKY